MPKSQMGKPYFFEDYFIPVVVAGVKWWFTGFKSHKIFSDGESFEWEWPVSVKEKSSAVVG